MGAKAIRFTRSCRTTPAMTNDRFLPFAFPAVASKKITAAFDGRRMTSDGGVMVLAQAERRLAIAEKLAAVPIGSCSRCAMRSPRRTRSQKSKPPRDPVQLQGRTPEVENISHRRSAKRINRLRVILHRCGAVPFGFTKRRAQPESRFCCSGIVRGSHVRSISNRTPLQCQQ